MTGDEWTPEDREKYEQLKKKIQESHANDHPTIIPVIIQQAPGVSAGSAPDYSGLFYSPTYRVQQPQPDGPGNLLEEIAMRTLQNVGNGSRQKFFEIAENCAKSLPWHTTTHAAQPAKRSRSPPPPRPAPQRQPFGNINIQMPRGRGRKK